MSTAIIFGMGSIFEQYKEIIYDMFTIVGYSSNNYAERDRFSPYYCPEEIYNINVDFVIICSKSEIEIFNQLLQLNIPKERIIIAPFDLEIELSTSQYGEDLQLLFLLGYLYNGDYSKVHYIELGTFHPVKLNNTWALYRQGARGILVEPNKTMHNLITKYRPDDKLLPFAVVPEKTGTMTFYETNFPALSTLKADSFDAKGESSDFALIREYPVSTITVNEIFELIKERIDVLSIDIEGMDYEVLSAIDWTKHNPGIVIAELVARGRKQLEGDIIVALMRSNGYKLLDRPGVNAIFISKEYLNIFRNF